MLRTGQLRRSGFYGAGATELGKSVLELMPQPETIRSRLRHLLTKAAKDAALPAWPPDLFCACASILQSSGAYSRVVDDDDPETSKWGDRNRAEHLRDVGAAWACNLSASKTAPTEVYALWEIVQQNQRTRLIDLGSAQQGACRDALLDLLAISDEVCAGVGIGQDESVFLSEVEDLLLHTMVGKKGATLCKEIDPSRARVLPKMHTPQSGLTIRSLSHHICFLPGMDTRPFWYSSKSSSRTHARNLLLVPWPKEIDPAQFKATKTRDITDSVGDRGYGLFTFLSTEGPSVASIQELLTEAERKVGHIDGIIFPELSMNAREFEVLSEAFATPDRFIIAGVGEQAGVSAGRNIAMMDLVPSRKPDKDGDYVRARIEQKKHHRWELDKRQIVQYGIGGNLHPEAPWWEHIELGDREIAFVTFAEWFTMSLLICEDLARPDPVGDVIRAIGPNLIVALLSDGPQIESRWPGRYASGFADDPGSSVLTLTSRGMSTLSKPIDSSKDRSGTIALWRDAKTGTTEIFCPSSADGVVLTVTAEYHKEWTADGRTDSKGGYPVLSGHHPIELKR